MFQLFKTRASSKLKAFVQELKGIETQETSPEGYVNAEYFRNWKVYYLQVLEDARGCDATLHGSSQLVRRQIAIYEEWEQKAQRAGLVPAEEFQFAFSNDVVLARIRGEEYLQSNEEEKDRTRKIALQYGFHRNSLYSFELYDLPWLLELKERGWLPKSIERYNLLTERNDRIDSEAHISFLSRVYNDSSDESHDAWKEQCRKYGREKLGLLDFERYDLPWLLEIQRSDLGFPYAVELQGEDGVSHWVTPEEWIWKVKTIQNPKFAGTG